MTVTVPESDRSELSRHKPASSTSTRISQITWSSWRPHRLRYELTEVAHCQVAGPANDPIALGHAICDANNGGSPTHTDPKVLSRAAQLGLTQHTSFTEW